MRLAIMQPYFFPYLGYFQLIAAVDKFVIYDDVNFINRGWINRNSILINGQKSNFTIQLKEASQNKLISEIEILKDGGKWQAKFLKTIFLAYKKASQFELIYALLQSILAKEYKSIGDLASGSIREVVSYLDVKTHIIETSKIYNNQFLKGQDRIIDIVIKENGNLYINPSGGIQLYSQDLFSKKQVQLKFIHTELCVYKQFNNDFVPNLSMIDVLMFNTKSQIVEMLSKYSLK